MKKLVIPIILIAFSLMAMKADKSAYQIYNIKGKKVSYAKLFKQAVEADVVLFGELHNNPICHWLQLELTADLFNEKGDQLVLGAEMFERDGQLILDEYIDGEISTRSFESQARLWPNYETDYKPLIEFAKENSIPFIATNIPRRYASIVFGKGFEGLDELGDHAKMFFPPLPIPYDPSLPGYQAMLEMGEGMGGHGSDNFPKAQAIKDASMAYFILENLDEGQVFVHYHGTYHSNNFEGIVWYLNAYRPGLKIMTIGSVEQASLDALEEENDSIADFMLVIPESMTKTH
ncbi:MAG: iron-regulated protein [Bacteroidetes bacterium]|nr:MAG: iron-regulated protein [Bacteroidota bacterium]